MNLENENSQQGWEIPSPGDIIEEISDGLAVVNSKGQILEVNDSFLRLFGYQDIEFGEKKIQSLISEKERLEEFLEKEFDEDNGCKNIELTGLRKDGEDFYVLLNGTKVESVESDLYLLIFRDITERKRELEDLRQKKNFLDALMVSSPDQIYFKDRNHRFILLNEATAENLGTTVEEAVGKTDFDFFPKDLAEEYYDDEEKVMDTGEPMVNKEEVVCHDGDDTWNFSTKVPIFDEEGEVIGVAGINRDITERVKSKEELDGLEAELKSSLEESKVEKIPSEDDESC